MLLLSKLNYRGDWYLLRAKFTFIRYKLDSDKHLGHYWDNILTQWYYAAMWVIRVYLFWEGVSLATSWLKRTDLHFHAKRYFTHKTVLCVIPCMVFAYEAAGVSDDFTKKMEEWENRKKKSTAKGTCGISCDGSVILLIHVQETCTLSPCTTNLQVS